VEAWEQEVRNPSGPALLLLDGLMASEKKTTSESSDEHE
jgi:DNA-binding transcriptional regulator YiaG